MPGNTLAFGPGLRKAGSLSESHLFVRAASSSTESNKSFIHSVVGFVLKEGGWYLVFQRGLARRCHLQAAQGPLHTVPISEGFFLCCDAVVFP